MRDIDYFCTDLFLLLETQSAADFVIVELISCLVRHH